MNVILGNLGMKSARIVKPNVPLEVQELETPRPKGPQVLIKVESSGVCHSDIHLWEGGYEVLPSHPLQIRRCQHLSDALVSQVNYLCPRIDCKCLHCILNN